MRQHLMLLPFLFLLTLLPALADDQDLTDEERRDYSVRLNRLESRANKALNGLTRADLTTHSLADRLEQTYMSASRIVYYEDFEQATATLRPAVTELEALVSDLKVLVADIEPEATLNRKATLLRTRIEKLTTRLEGEHGLAAAGKRVEEFANKLVNEVRIPPSNFPLTNGERTMANEIGSLAERADKALSEAEKLATELVSKSTPENSED